MMSRRSWDRHSPLRLSAKSELEFRNHLSVAQWRTLPGMPSFSGLSVRPVYPLFKYAYFGNPALNRASDLLYGVMQPPILGLSVTQFIYK